MHKIKVMLLGVYGFFIHLFNGIKESEKIIMGDKDNSFDIGFGEEQQQEQDSLWQDLVKHELTQRVKELRYETEHVSRKSKNYEYIGGGFASKKSMFDYNGKCENRENYKISLVQENKENISGVISGHKEVKEYRLKLTYDFIPRFRLDSYVKKIVVKKTSTESMLVDFYVYKYLEKYNNKHKFFLSEINKIINGDRRSDILNFNSFTFTTNNAYGADDGITLTFSDISFVDIVEYDGSYVLKFNTSLVDIEDYIDTVYDKEAERKFNEKEERKQYKQDFTTLVGIENEKNRNDEYYKKVKETISVETDGK